MAVAAATGVVGREDELAALRRALEREGPTGVACVGEPGIGKTMLWRAAIAEAVLRGFRVLQARPAEAESETAFAALGDVLSEVVDDVLAALAPPRRSALAVALLLEDSPGGQVDQRAVSLAVLDSLRILATSRGVLVAIDDAQWVDPASRSVLAFALRRLEAEPITVLLSHRQNVQVDLGLPVERIEIAPLSLGAIHVLVQARCGFALRRPMLRRLHEVSGGNPLYALELARAFERGVIRLEPGEPLPNDVRALVSARLEELSSATRLALGAAAAAARPTLGLLSTALGEGAADAVAPALDAGVAELDDEAIRFTHPLLASAAYALVTTTERRALHGRLAAATASEERARHLALAAERPDESIAVEIEAGARMALARGAPASAAALAAHAARLTPPERPEHAILRRTLEADARFEAGDIEQAVTIVDELIAALRPGPTRAPLLGRRQRYGHFGEDLDARIDLSLQALAEAGDDPALRAELHEGIAWGLMRRDVAAAVEHARAAVRLAEQTGDRARLAETLAAQGVMEFIGGADPWALLDEACALEDAVLELRVLRHPTYARAYCLACADRLDEARAAFIELERRALEHGDETDLVHILKHLALLECRAGYWDEAERIAADGLALAEQTGQRPQQASLLARTALLASLRGEEEAARALAKRAVETATGLAVTEATPQRVVAGAGEVALWALGLLALVTGDFAEADRQLAPLTRVLLDAGIRDPGELRCLVDAVEAKAGTGDLKTAEKWAEVLERSARSVERASALAAAARARGLVAGARGDVAGAVTALQTALRNAPPDLPFEHARTLLALGSAQRRANQRRAARTTLERARGIFDQLGSWRWSQRSSDELARLSGRRARGDELTEAELRVAELVAEGRTNREVAHALVVAERTVEWNLSKIYRKLGIRSRAELARRFAELR